MNEFCSPSNNTVSKAFWQKKVLPEQRISYCEGIYSNSISDIEVNSFMNLTECTQLRLDHNNLAHINSDTFTGLQSLIRLNLDRNNILQIEPGSFMNLTQLRVVHLNDNQLSSVGEDLFDLRMSLTLLLDKNPLHCDHRMCWMKEAEQDGRITLSYNTSSGTFFDKPHCVNYQGVTWDNVTLDCDAKGKQFVLMKFSQNIFLTNRNESWQLSNIL